MYMYMEEVKEDEAEGQETSQLMIVFQLRDEEVLNEIDTVGFERKSG